MRNSLGPRREIKGSCEASALQVLHLLLASREPPITRPTISLLDQRLSQPVESWESVQIDPLGQWDSVESAPTQSEPKDSVHPRPVKEGRKESPRTMDRTLEEQQELQIPAITVHHLTLIHPIFIGENISAVFIISFSPSAL